MKCPPAEGCKRKGITHLFFLSVSCLVFSILSLAAESTMALVVMLRLSLELRTLGREGVWPAA